MSNADIGVEIGRFLMEHDPDLYAHMVSPRGTASHTQWTCEDQWIVGYTTERISQSRGGVNDGKFAAMAWRPVGKGSQSGKAREWKMVYFRTFAKRKSARARAETLYYRHSPRRAKRHGVSA